MPGWQTHPTHRRLGAYVLRITAMGSLLAAVTLGSIGSGAKADGISLVGYGSSAGHAMPSGAARTAPDGAGGPLVSSFSIAGGVGGLFPGKKFALVLTVTNPQNVAITVTSISTTVSDASSLCVAAKVKVTTFSGQLHVAAGKKAKATVHVTMTHSAPDACEGAVFPFQYNGLATAA